jgi:hypothetical protein
LKRKPEIAEFRVFELDMEGSNSLRNVRQPFDALALTNTTWQKKKVGGTIIMCVCDLNQFFAAAGTN